ncbi:hypothetical protein ml_508 [Mollivirus sibericum]|uniref:hypothetical protein n=1 Tax=Mollivirus sibericum TaxID=1678078 RepID=UPI0006B2EDB7|nr:hypothetical protein ml_508 [Mollivirus sibericum]ALD62310.1 hypothetical protein ml_508 [Mollivirus sibericum]
MRLHHNVSPSDSVVPLGRLGQTCRYRRPTNAFKFRLLKSPVPGSRPWMLRPIHGLCRLESPDLL